MSEQRGRDGRPSNGSRRPGQSRGSGASSGRGGDRRDKGSNRGRSGDGRGRGGDSGESGGGSRERGRGDEQRGDRGGRRDRGRGEERRADRGGRRDYGRGDERRGDSSGRRDRGRGAPRRSGGDGDVDGERRSGARGLRGDGRTAPPEAGPRSWGGLARRGAARLNEDESLLEAELEPDFVPPSEEEDPEGFAKHEARQAKRAAGDANRERLREEARAAISRSGQPAPKPKKARRSVPPARERSPLAPRKLPDPKRQLKVLLGDSGGGRAWRDLNQAAEHLDAGRAGQARVIAERLHQRAPEVIEIAELYGLALYGQGRWRDAIEVLEEVRASSGLADQNPVLADAHRAIGNYLDVEYLWSELREVSPASALMNEGRIVASGALADQGRMQDAVRLLSKGWKRPKRPHEHHLRRAYALADLYERAGERPQAKELFAWIAHHEPGYLDVSERAL